MEEQELVPNTDEEVVKRLTEIFGDLNVLPGGALYGIYCVRREFGDSVKRAWLVAMCAGAGESVVPDYYLDEE